MAYSKWLLAPGGHTLGFCTFAHFCSCQEVPVSPLPSLVPLDRVAYPLSVLEVSFYSDYHSIGHCWFPYFLSFPDAKTFENRALFFLVLKAPGILPITW